MTGLEQPIGRYSANTGLPAAAFAFSKTDIHTDYALPESPGLTASVGPPVG
jgi:hypothetical protein